MTANEIERLFYDMTVNGCIGDAISGTVYRKDMRPDNSREEDAVVALTGCIDGQIQEGDVILNIYTNGLLKKSKLVPDYEKIGYLESLIPTLLEDINMLTMLHARTETTPNVMKIEGPDQYCIVAHIKFRLLTTD